MRVLGCESSCDETGLAVYDTEQGLLAHALHSQADLHALYGGVVPELASRDHVRRLTPLVAQVLDAADTPRHALDAVAYTAGPGLAGALLTGAMFARAYAWGLGIPAIPVHHMEGHLLAPMLEPEQPRFPFVCLLVSGGHTQLVRVDGVGRYRLLGESIDDAAGEAFDKTAKMLGLPYPGGPHLAALAEAGDPDAIALPRPMLDRPGLEFSFSGLKTAAITRYRHLANANAVGSAGAGTVLGDGGTSAHGTTDGSADEPADAPAQAMADLAASFQAAVVDTLLGKAERALRQEQLTCLVISGGVSANQHLREQARARFESRGIEVFYPSLAFCTDNGAMIALAGALRLAAGMDGEQAESLAVRVRPRWPLDALSADGASDR